jgi:NAD(P)-dependent dehydrogenase (short-subunit alcohol dehydrogenase family)
MLFESQTPTGENMSRHTDHVIWVTGAASGIGRATAELLVEQGAKVLATDIAAEPLSWAKGVRGIETCVCDVTDRSANETAVEMALDRFGKLTGAALNAGVTGSMPIDDPTGLDLLSLNLDVNVVGVVHGIRAALPALRANGGGAFTVTASTSGMGGDPGMWAYNAAKGAVINLVRSVAVELGHENIRINAVAPGPTETGMTQGLLGNGPNPISESLRQRVPLQRWGLASEQAAAPSFLLSSEASFITGAVLPVDGGVTANTGQFAPPGRAATQ